MSESIKGDPDTDLIAAGKDLFRSLGGHGKREGRIVGALVRRLESLEIEVRRARAAMDAVENGSSLIVQAIAFAREARP